MTLEQQAEKQFLIIQKMNQRINMLEQNKEHLSKILSSGGIIDSKYREEAEKLLFVVTELQNKLQVSVSELSIVQKKLDDSLALIESEKAKRRIIIEENTKLTTKLNLFANKDEFNPLQEQIDYYKVSLAR